MSIRQESVNISQLLFYLYDTSVRLTPIHKGSKTFDISILQRSGKEGKDNAEGMWDIRDATGPCSVSRGLG